MVTSVHESLLSLDKFLALLWFSDSITEARQIVDEGYDYLRETLDRLRESERSFTRQVSASSNEIIRAGKKFLKQRHFEKVHEHYRKIALARHRRAEKILKRWEDAKAGNG